MTDHSTHLLSLEDYIIKDGKYKYVYIFPRQRMHSEYVYVS